MRRIWAFIVAIVLFGLMAWNLLTGQPVLNQTVATAALVLIAFTLSWWFETHKT